MGVLPDLLLAQGLTGHVLTRRVADHAGEIPDKEHHMVAQVLELAQLVDQYRVAQVQIRRGGVESGLYPQGPASGEALGELLLDEDLLGAAFDFIQSVH